MMTYDLKDEKQAQEYLQNVSIEYRFQCYKEKNPEGCHRLADFLESVKKEYEKAAKVYKVNCDDNKYGHSCFKYGNYNIIGRGMERNDAVGMAYYVKGCDYGYMPSCHNVGLVHSSSKVGPPKDMKKALEYFQKACDKEHIHSCYQISGMYITGSEDVPKDMKKAFDYSVKACDMGHMYACSNLSQMYRKGEGVGKDLNLAEKFRIKAKEIYDSQTQKRQTMTFSE